MSMFLLHVWFGSFVFERTIYQCAYSFINCFHSGETYLLHRIKKKNRVWSLKQSGNVHNNWMTHSRTNLHHFIVFKWRLSSGRSKCALTLALYESIVIINTYFTFCHQTYKKVYFDKHLANVSYMRRTTPLLNGRKTAISQF